jgi:hypothetical protein
MLVDQPVPFQGTEAEKIVNRTTHFWTQLDEHEIYCGNCDCKPWHAAADYPCGTEPPRQVVEIKDEEVWWRD